MQGNVERVSRHAEGIDDQHGEHAAGDQAHSDTREGVDGRLDHEQPVECDIMSCDAWGVECSGRIEPGAPGGITSSQDSFTLCSCTGAQGEGGCLAECARGGDFDDCTTRQAAIGQGRFEGRHGNDARFMAQALPLGQGEQLAGECGERGHILNIRSDTGWRQSIVAILLSNEPSCCNVPASQRFSGRKAMKLVRMTRSAAGMGAFLMLTACDPPIKPDAKPAVSASAAPAKAVKYDTLDRATFNRVAVQMDLPIYWIEDKNGNKAIDPDETASLLFYPVQGNWVDGKSFTASFEETYKKMVAWSQSPVFPSDITPEEKTRRQLVIEELDQGQPTLVFTDFAKRSNEDKTFVRHMLAVANLIDELHARQQGLAPWAAQLPKDDPSSHGVFRRNWGPKCLAPKTEKNEACSAIPNSPKKILSDVYPADIQKEDGFCERLEKHADAKKLLAPFVVVRKEGEELKPVPVTEAYKDLAEKVAKKLRAAADVLPEAEAALKAYLTAASQSFQDNNWEPADEAWSKMNATNSKWYVRVGPDEVYWSPCNRKAGFHLSFASINEASLNWQKKLEPVQQQMEDDLAKLIGAPYKARTVTFHLPDFIDIVANAGDSRHPLGATVGQSLPNWGPVANEGRGRTVVMSNLYTDPDSLFVRKAQTESMLDAATMKKSPTSPDPALFSIILHEATHNFGPSAEYKVKGKTDDEIFGGPLASTMEELKAQSGALWYIKLLLDKKIVNNTFAEESYVDAFIWALNHIARGMYTDDGKPKTYSHVAAIQVGFLMAEGAITFDPKLKAANGKDEGAFTIDFGKLPAAVEKLMQTVGSIKAKGEKAKAEELVKKYVDGDVVPMKLIAERSLRHPKAAFLYSVRL